MLPIKFLVKTFKKYWPLSALLCFGFIKIFAEPSFQVIGLPEELETAFLEEQTYSDSDAFLYTVQNTQAILNFLQKEGFHGALIEKDQSENNNSSSIFRVTLGKATKIEKIFIASLNANTDLELLKELDQVSQQSLDLIANHKNYDDIQKLILKKCTDYGYLNPVLKKKKFFVYPDHLDSSLQKATWTFLIDPGPPSFFGPVSYINQKVEIKYLEDLQPFSLGTPILKEDREEFRNNLIQTGWFEDARLLLTPNPENQSLQDITVFCVPRTASPLSISGSLKGSGIDAFVDLKFPMINRYGHQFELKFSWIDLKSLWQKNEPLPNSFLINYTLPRFKMPFFQKMFRSDIAIQRSLVTRKLHCCDIESEVDKSITRFDFQEDFLQCRSILSQMHENFDTQISFYNFLKVNSSSKSLKRDQANIDLTGIEALAGKWWSIGLGKTFLALSNRKTSSYYNHIPVTDFLSKTEFEFKTMLFSRMKDVTRKQMPETIGLWCSQSFLLPIKNLRLGSFNCPLKIRTRFQTSLLFRGEPQNFLEQVHPKFRCFSGGEIFLIGYDSDSVAPKYSNGTYGGKNSLDFSSSFGHMRVRISGSISNWSFFACQTFFNTAMFTKSPQKHFAMQLGTIGLRILTNLGALGKLAIYVGQKAPWSPLNAESTVFKNMVFRLRLEQ